MSGVVRERPRRACAAVGVSRASVRLESPVLEFPIRPILWIAGALALTASSFVLVRRAAGDDPAPKPAAVIKDVMLSINEGEQSVVGHLRSDFGGELDDDGWAVAKARATMLMEVANLDHGMKPPLGADDAADDAAGDAADDAAGDAAGETCQ